MNVSRSAYYAGSRKVIDDNRLKIKVRLRELHSASRGAAGSRTLMHQLRKAGIPAGCWKVSRLMKEFGLISRQPGGHRYRICPEESVASPNRDLSPGNRTPFGAGISAIQNGVGIADRFIPNIITVSPGQTVTF
nr:IS3 family transposase [Photorhabdus cinerea]